MRAMGKPTGLGALCRELGYSRQSYYQAKAREHQRELEESAVLTGVRAVRELLPETGGRKLQKHLRQTGILIGRDRLLRILKHNDLLVRRKKNYRRTTNSTHGFRVYRNLVKRHRPTGPNEVMVTDITYLRTLEGFCYLSLLMDLYSRKVIGYHVSKSLAVEGSVKALRMALRGVEASKGMIHHSDRGIQYCSKAYSGMLMRRGVRISMTEEVHVYENANAERLNGILKQELGLGGVMPSFKVAKKLVREAIDLYNNKRLHLALNYRTPVEVHTA